MIRVALTAALLAFCVGATLWGSQHAAELRMERVHRVVRARDMQKLTDHRQLLRCQERVMMDEEYEQTAVMVAHSALKHAGMEQ